MGKGSRRHRTANKKKKKTDKISTNTYLGKTSMVRKPKETKKGISSAEPRPAILMPGTPEYETSLEKIYGKKGPPAFDDDPVSRWAALEDAREILTLNAKEKAMAMRRGELSPEDDRKVLLVKDHLLSFPELYLSVYVSGPPEDTKGFAQLFARAQCYRANDPYEADLVVFTGGPDVDPAYYGESRHHSTDIDDERDYADMQLFIACLDEGIPMTGICRGAQALAVWNGYKLFQDVDNHVGDHYLWDMKKQQRIDKASSVHHQQVIPGKGMEILAVTHKSTIRYRNNNSVQTASSESSPFMDLEAYFIRDTCCFGVQGHPEYKSYNAFSKWYLDNLYELVNLNPDVEWNGNRRRLKKELIKEREYYSTEERYSVTDKGKEIITVNAEPVGEK